VRAGQRRADKPAQPACSATGLPWFWNALLGAVQRGRRVNSHLSTSAPPLTPARYAPSITWRHVEAWGCNGGANPTVGPHAYDGAPLDPLEAMFVKVKAAQARAPWVRKARAYARWRREEAEAAAGRRRRGVSANAAHTDADAAGEDYLQRVLSALNGGGGGRTAAGGKGGGTAAAAAGVGALLEAPPDNGRGLPAELAGLYAAYVGQFM
jgi:hypothetical protein